MEEMIENVEIINNLITGSGAHETEADKSKHLKLLVKGAKETFEGRYSQKLSQKLSGYFMHVWFIDTKHIFTLSDNGNIYINPLL